MSFSNAFFDTILQNGNSLDANIASLQVKFGLIIAQTQITKCVY
jgi:hypothetical protein